MVDAAHDRSAQRKVPPNAPGEARPQGPQPRRPRPPGDDGRGRGGLPRRHEARRRGGGAGLRAARLGARAGLPRRRPGPDDAWGEQPPHPAADRLRGGQGALRLQPHRPGHRPARLRPGDLEEHLPPPRPAGPLRALGGRAGQVAEGRIGGGLRLPQARRAGGGRQARRRPGGGGGRGRDDGGLGAGAPRRGAAGAGPEGAAGAGGGARGRGPGRRRPRHDRRHPHPRRRRGRDRPGADPARLPHRPLRPAHARRAVGAVAAAHRGRPPGRARG